MATPHKINRGAVSVRTDPRKWDNPQEQHCVRGLMQPFSSSSAMQGRSIAG